MKIAYFDCFSGISGDMLIGALLDAGLDFDALSTELGKLGLSNYDLKCQKTARQNLSACKFDVIDKEKQVFRHLKDLNRIVDDSSLDEPLQSKAKAIFLKIAGAEAKIHNQPIEKVHFHEISAIDTIIDVVGALVGIQLLNIEKIYSSKLNVGAGFVEFSHGKWPVPAPATAEILKGVPIYATDCQAELVTPTGAAIISTIASRFGDMPEMTTERVGYGAGSQDLQHPNVLRVFIGDGGDKNGLDEDVVAMIETNIDDMNPQLYEQVSEALYKNGALEVYLTPIQMKKNRPGILLTVLANPVDENKLAEVIFRNTTTIGVRLHREKRRKLRRSFELVETRFGPIKFKVTSLNGEVLNHIPEYEDCKKIAETKKLPLKNIYDELTKLEFR